MSERMPLKSGYRLKIRREEYEEEYLIEGVIGEGSTCIAYKGKFIFSKEHNITCPVVIKEVYPRTIPLVRNKDNSLIVDPELDDDVRTKKQEEFEKIQKQFERTNNRIFAILNDQDIVFSFGNGNHTRYAITKYEAGCILSEHAERNSFSLIEIADLCISLCEYVCDIHNNGIYCLDIKPENIFIKESKNYENVIIRKAKPIDFDTAIIPGRNENNEKERITSRSRYSNGWAAPEQLVLGSEISDKTDLFSIVAVFFWLITRGKKPYSIPAKEYNSSELDLECVDYSVINAIQNDEFDWCSITGFYHDESVLDCIKEIAKKALTIDPNQRGYSYAKNLLGDFVRLKNEANQKVQNAYVNGIRKDVKNRFRYDSNSSQFFGRKMEVNHLVNMCKAQDKFLWTGIYGVGGSGKSRLAYEICERMSKERWIIKEPSHFESIKDEIIDIINEQRGNVLICLDYIKNDADNISLFLQSIIENYLHRAKYKIRIILIERDLKDVDIKDSKNEHYFYGFNNASNNNGFICTEPMNTADIANIVFSYIINQNVKDKEVFAEDIDTIINTLENVDQEYKRPVFALFIADAWLNNANLRSWTKKDSLDYLLERERERLSPFLAQNILTPMKRENYKNAIEYILAIATYLGSVEINELESVLINEFDIQMDTIIDLMSEYGNLYDKTTVIGWKPDLIGEYYCVKLLDGNDFSEERRKRFFEFILNKNLTEFARYSKMIFDDYFKDSEESESDLHSWLTSVQNTEIPEQYLYIRSNLFKECGFLKSISFRGRMNVISHGSFRNCENLETIVLPTSIESIGNYAFDGCINLENIETPGELSTSVRHIGIAAFRDCIKLKKTPISKMTKEIGGMAFKGCKSMKVVGIPPLEVEIGNSAFENCESLEEIRIDSSSYALDIPAECFKSCIKLKVVLGSERITSVKRDAFWNCRSLKRVTFSGNLKEIQDNSFKGCESLRGVRFNNSNITSIPMNLFYNCSSLSYVRFPKKIKRIEKNAFYNCENLSGISRDISELEVIAECAFYNCKRIRRVDIINSSLIELGEKSFENCSNLELFSVGNKIKKIGVNAFRGCDKLDVINSFVGFKNSELMRNLCGFSFSKFGQNEIDFIKNYSEMEEVTIPDSVTAIKERAFFDHSKVKKIFIPKTVTRIEASAFMNCFFLEEISLYKINYLGEKAFKGCVELKRIIGKIDVSRIDDETFQNCQSLEELHFTKKINSVGKNAFRGCKRIKPSVVLNGWIPLCIESRAFEGCDLDFYPVNVDIIKKYKLDPKKYNIEGFFFNRITEKEIDFISNYRTKKNLKIPGSCYKLDNPYFDRKLVETVSIPRTISVLPSEIFLKCEELVRVYLPDSLKKIEKGAFQSCTKLSTICFKTEDGCPPPDLIIEEGAFCDCRRLSQFALPKGIRIIEKNLFCNCFSLKKINIPKTVTCIKGNAFKGCKNLHEVELPELLETLGGEAFKGCDSLEEIKGLQNTKVKIIERETFSSCINLKKIELPRNLKEIRDESFVNCQEMTISKFLPATLEVIGKSAFQRCFSIESIILPPKIKRIENNTFRNCSSLTEIVMKMSRELQSIGEYAFDHCSRITNLDLPQGLEQLGEGAFANCTTLESIEIREPISYLPVSAFESCVSIKEMRLPDSIRVIGNNCFRNCFNLSNVYFNEGLLYINAGAFRNCHELLSDRIKFPNSLKGIGPGAFAECIKLEEMEIPSGIDTIDKTVFYDCICLKKVIFTGSIRDINEYAFTNCVSLTDFSFQKVENKVGNAAFENCKSLLELDFSPNIKEIGAGCFRGCDGVKEVVFPETNDITVIKGATFREMNGLKKVTIPSNIVTVKKSAFRDCKMLEEVVIKSSEILIEGKAFAGCERLYNVDATANPFHWKIEETAFNETPVYDYLRNREGINWFCFEQLDNKGYKVGNDIDSNGLVLIKYIKRGIGDIVIPETIFDKPVTIIGTSCFEEKNSIDSFKIPSTILKVEDNAFAFCKSIKEIEIPDSVQYTGRYVFKGCESLEEVYVSNNVTEIKKGMFIYCRRLLEVTLSNNIKKIETNAFRGCVNLRIVIPDSVEVIEKGAFGECVRDDIVVNHMPVQDNWFDIIE